MLEQILENAYDNVIKNVGESVIDMAYDIFETCDAKEDFCVQHVGKLVVFGGTNRLILGPYGWRIDEPYCRPEFIKLFNKNFK